MQEMYMTRKPSEEGHRKPVAGPVGAEELYRRYLSIRAEREKSRNKTDPPATELKKADMGDILS
jgi:hypothetical protein